MSVTTATEPRERWQDKSRLWLGSVLPLVVLLGLLGLVAVAPLFEWSGRIGSVGFGAWIDRDGFLPDLPQGVSSQDTSAVRGWTLRVGGLYWGVVTVPDR